MREVLVFLGVLLCISTIASQGIEVQNITVEGHYGFGTASSDIAMLTLFVEQGNTEFKHHSASLTATVNFSPGFVLTADYAIDKVSDILIDGEVVDVDEEVFTYYNSQQLSALSLGYPYHVASGFQVTPFLGVGHFSSREKIKLLFAFEDGEVLDADFVIRDTSPQLGLAIEYNVTQKFSLCANVATFLGSKGKYFQTDNTVAEQLQMELELKLFRWQGEGRYLIKPNLLATAGYRVRNLSVAATTDDEEKIVRSSESKGFFLGIQYIF